MANGAVVRLPDSSLSAPAPDEPGAVVALEPNGQHYAPTTAAPGIAAANPAATATEAEIGTVLVQAAGLMFLEASQRIRGEASTWGGGLETGELIAKLYFWQQSMGPDFTAVAIRAGRACLRRTLTPEAARHPDLESALDDVLSLPLAVLASVIEREQEFARTRTH